MPPRQSRVRRLADAPTRTVDEVAAIAICQAVYSVNSCACAKGSPTVCSTMVSAAARARRIFAEAT